MLDDDKPALNDALLMHYGVAGMKWGHRKMANTADIHSARKQVKSAKQDYKAKVKAAKSISNAKTRTAKLAALDKTHAKMLQNPDRVTSARMTRGQKIIATVLFPPGGLAAIAVTSARSRRIERKQDEKKYSPKK